MINDIFSSPNPIKPGRRLGKGGRTSSGAHIANVSATRSVSKESLIQIDYREKNSLVPAKLIKENLEIEFKELKIGDYLVKNTIIERKTINDFAQSMINGRLKKQLQEIKQYENYLLIIEGNLYKIKNIHPNAIKGFILSISINHKVPIIFTNDEEETASYISIIAKRQKKENSLNPKKIDLTSVEQQLFILQSFPNIGPTKSKQLLEKFSNLKNIFNAKEKELEEILGNKSKEFVKWLEFPYKNSLKILEPN